MLCWQRTRSVMNRWMAGEECIVERRGECVAEQDAIWCNWHVRSQAVCTIWRESMRLVSNEPRYSEK